MATSVFGLHRRKRNAFFAEIGKARHSRSKAGPRRSKTSHFKEKGFKNIPKLMDGNVCGLYRRKRVAFLAKFGEAGIGRRKAGLGHMETGHVHGNSEKMTGCNRVWTAQA